MTSAVHQSLLANSVLALRGFGLVPEVGKALAASAEATATELQKRVVEEVAAFSESANPDILPELRAHLDAIVAEVCRLLAGGKPGDLGFARAHAGRRAEQRFPLEASLHAYRCCHRVLSNRIRDAALAAADQDAQLRRVIAAAADFAIEFTDAISTLATSEYVLQTRRLAEAEGDQRAELLNILLGGYDESDSRAAQLLRRAGYLEQRQSFCIVAARSIDPREMEHPARAKRMVEAVADALHDSPVRVLSGVREGIATLVLSATRRASGWTAPQSLLADRVYPRLLQVGPAAVIGLSSDAPATGHLRRAHHEALTALDFASVANRVQAYGQIPFRRMIVRHARDNMQAALPRWLAPLQKADQKARGTLSATLKAYADANMNALQAAKDLGVHANTIYSRMQRISDVSGRNALAYHDLTELLLAIESSDKETGQTDV